MSVSIHQILDEFGELAAQIYEGNDTGNFVQRECCLLLADQLAARTLRLQADLRGGRLPEALALRELGTEGDFRARMLALNEALNEAVDAALDTLDAIAGEYSTWARQRVSEGVYLLWQLNAALEVMRAPGFTPPTSLSAAGPVYPERKDEGR